MNSLIYQFSFCLNMSKISNNLHHIQYFLFLDCQCKIFVSWCKPGIQCISWWLSARYGKNCTNLKEEIEKERKDTGKQNWRRKKKKKLWLLHPVLRDSWALDQMFFFYTARSAGQKGCVNRQQFSKNNNKGNNRPLVDQSEQSSKF